MKGGWCEWAVMDGNEENTCMEEGREWRGWVGDGCWRVRVYATVVVLARDVRDPVV